MDATEFHTILTVVFFVAFIALVIWVYLPGRKARQERHGELPFVDEDATARKEKNDHE